MRRNPCPASLAVGNGTAGDFTGALKLKSILITDTVAGADICPATITGGNINGIQVTGKLGNRPLSTVVLGNASVTVVRVPKGQTYPRG